jgi:hypothetical protein
LAPFSAAITALLPSNGDVIAGDIGGISDSYTGKHQYQSPREAIDYVADTMGELGLFYRLGGPVFVGKSLAVGGGQNPFEPALLGAPVLFGPLILTGFARSWTNRPGERRLAGIGLGLLAVEGQAVGTAGGHAELGAVRILADFQPVAANHNRALGQDDPAGEDADLLKIVIAQRIRLNIHGLVAVGLFGMHQPWRACKAQPRRNCQRGK